MKLIKKTVLWLLMGYKKRSCMLWNFLPIFFMYPSCKFYPTCSEYAYDSFEQYGLRRGLVMTIKRVIRCSPLPLWHF